MSSFQTAWKCVNMVSCSVYYSKDVRLPVQLQRAMATEAEAAREARAKVSHKQVMVMLLSGWGRHTKKDFLACPSYAPGKWWHKSKAWCGTDRMLAHRNYHAYYIIRFQGSVFDQVNLCLQQSIMTYNKEKMKPLTVQTSHYPPVLMILYFEYHAIYT